MVLCFLVNQVVSVLFVVFFLILFHKIDIFHLLSELKKKGNHYSSPFQINQNKIQNQPQSPAGVVAGAEDPLDTASGDTLSMTSIPFAIIASPTSTFLMKGG